jgi:hypothetical protein
MARLLYRTRDLWPADFRRSRPRAFHGPAQRPAALAPLAPQETIDEIMRLVRLGGDGWARDMVVDTLGKAAAPREYSEVNARRRGERARIMEAAWEEFLAGQYPNVRVRVRWGAVQNGALTAGARPRGLLGAITAAHHGWKVLLRFEVRQ